MEFLTIHELSTQFDTPARVIRYRFHKLRLAGQLAEGVDYRREDYVDDQHFEWKINPVTFMRAAGMTLAPVATRPLPPTGNNAATKPESTVTKMDNQPPPSGNTPSEPVIQRDDAVTKKERPIDTKPAEPGLEREMIELLKDQVRVKDDQIGELNEQNKKLNDLNVKLVGTTVQQAQRIENLLRLTGGKTDLSEMVTKTDNKTPPVDNQPDAPVTKTDNQDEDPGYQTDEREQGREEDKESRRAA